VTQATRAAERNKFAHHRANLMFAGYLSANRQLYLPWAATVHEGTEPPAGEVPTPLLRQIRAADSAGDK
jgi:hypothetical protein